MIRAAAVLGLAAGMLAVKAYGGVPPAQQPPAPQRWQSAYRVSLVALAGASVADAATSWGKREANPQLRGADGRFGWRGVAVKSAYLGGAGAWNLWMRRHRRFATVVNFGAAAAYAGMAIRNARVQR